MGSRHGWIFPAFSFVFITTAFFLSYAIAIARNDVQKIWPYISDTGALPPESCVFGQLVNMSAGFMMVSLYLRHRHVLAHFRKTKKERPDIVISSRVFLAVGIFATFGLMTVANFQEQNVTTMHFAGAFTAFSLGLAYGWYQTLISFISPQELTPRWLTWFRLIISLVGTVSFIGIFAIDMVHQHHPLEPSVNATISSDVSTPKIYRRGPGEPGYEALLVTTISEWCLGICLGLFFLSLAFDLHGVKLRAVKLQLRTCPGRDRGENAIWDPTTSWKLPQVNENIGNGGESVRHSVESEDMENGDSKLQNGLRRMYDRSVHNANQWENDSGHSRSQQSANAF